LSVADSNHLILNIYPNPESITLIRTLTYSPPGLRHDGEMSLSEGARKCKLASETTQPS